MLKNFNLSQGLSGAFLKSSLWVALISFVCKSAAFFREFAMLNSLGAGKGLDLILIGQTVYLIIVGSFASLFEVCGVTRIARLLKDGAEEDARCLSGHLLMVATSISLVCATLVAVFGRVILKVFAPGMMIGENEIVFYCLWGVGFFFYLCIALAGLWWPSKGLRVSMLRPF